MTILDHPEYGQTISRADGFFDLAVNGGSEMTVVYEMGGYLGAQRKVAVPWQDFVVAPDVVLVQLDPQVTTIDFTAPAAMQVARGSPVSDADGSRQATILFPAGRTAELVLADGTRQPVSQLAVRATEFTVGESGEAAMPAELPATSAYTYALELSADEALAAGAERVEFSGPLPLYLENFLVFPVGEPMPLGYYDRQAGRWVPEQSGVILSVVGITGGMADVDITGDNLPDNSLALSQWGITAAERESLASLYAAGQSLWRVSVNHFSVYDLNLSFGLPEDGEAPDNGDPETEQDDKEPKPTNCRGSIIEVENQVLGESVDLVGVPFGLNYRSDRVPGRRAPYTVLLRVSGNSVPQSLKRIEVTVHIAGTRKLRVFAPGPNIHFEHTWDGLDSYGRPVQGSQGVDIETAYVYDAVYGGTGNFSDPVALRSGGAQHYGTRVVGGGGGGGGGSGGKVGVSFPRGSIPAGVSPNKVRMEARIKRFQRAILGAWHSQGQGLGGWTLSPHHAYDGLTKTVHRGDGSELGLEAGAEERAAQGRVNTIDTVAGREVADGGRPSYGAEGQQAAGNPMGSPTGIVAAADGGYYVALGTVQSPDNLVVRVGRDGIAARIAGTPGVPGYSGDGGPASAAKLFNPSRLALGPDGSLYVAEDGVVGDPSAFVGWGRRVRRIDPDGVISTVAGDGTVGFSGEDGPAVSARLSPPLSIAVDKEGVLYIADRGNKRIRRVGTDGIIKTIAGRSWSGINVNSQFNGDNLPALETNILPDGIAVDGKGRVFFSSGARLRYIDTEGVIRTIVEPDDETGNTITVAQLGVIAPFAFQDVLLTPQEDLLTVSRQRIWKVTPAGVLNVIVGGTGSDGVSGFSGDRGPAVRARVSAPQQLALLPNQALLIADRDNTRVRQVRRPFPATDVGEILIPDESGTEVYVFDETGRHLRTLDALLGVPLYEFSYAEYEGKQLLVGITDRDGQVTTVDRSPSGEPMAIVGHFGQPTSIALDASGYLESLTDPLGNRHSFNHGSGPTEGLLLSSADPNRNTHEFYYDEEGRLVEDFDPTGARKSLAGEKVGPLRRVTLTTGAGRTTAFAREWLSTGEYRRTTTFPDGTQTVVSTALDGTRTTTHADGMEETEREGPDPRWGMQAPVVESRTVSAPSGLQRLETRSRTVVPTQPADPLSITSYTETMTVNGRTYSTAFNQAARTFTTTTPEGRTSTAVVDGLGRVERATAAGLLPMAMTYDVNGNIAKITDGTAPMIRTASFGYDSQGYLSSSSDPLQRQTSFTYDAAGRVLEQLLPGERDIAFSYDPSGNLLTLAPPEKPDHVFAYSPLDLVSLYEAPQVGGAATRTFYIYDEDGKLIRTTRPDGETIDLDYTEGGSCNCGRLSSLTTPQGVTTYGYHPSTGNLTSIASPGGVVVSYGYNGGLITSETWSGFVSGSVGLTYNQDFDVVSQSLNGGSTIAFSYDDDGLLIQAGSMVLARDPQNGLLTGLTLGGISESFTYSGFAELSEHRASFGGVLLYANVYQRDQLGRIVQRIETRGAVSRTFEYGYEASGFLSQVRVDGAIVRSYAYDANGNRLSVTDASGTTAGVYDDQDHLLTYGDAAYSYRGADRLERKTDGSGETGFTYDALGNLLAVSKPDGTLIEYVVDGRNRRVGKKVNGAVVQKLIYQNQLSPVAELAPDNSVVSRFVYLGGSNVPAYMVRQGVVYALVRDHLGSPRLVVDVATGDVAQELEYDEFGRVVLDSNPGFQPFGFAGGIYDSETGLVRFGARDYDSQTGRWTAKDPIGFTSGDTNTYAYCHNEPINCVDPTGTDALSAARNFATGFASGAVGALAVGGLAAGAVALGAPAAVVSGALLAGALVGGMVLGYNIATDSYIGDWDAVAFDAGSIVGGGLAGGLRGRWLAESINGRLSPPWSLKSDLGQRYKRSLGPVGEWWRTGYNPGSAGETAALSGAGAAAAIRKDLRRESHCKGN